jgi:hypothetical protein
MKLQMRKSALEALGDWILSAKLESKFASSKNARNSTFYEKFTLMFRLKNTPWGIND